jgi:hypothetical protein
VFCYGFDLPQRVVVVADELDVFLPGVEAEGSDIPAAVPMQKSTPPAPEAAEGAPEPMQEVAEEAAAATGGEEATVPPEVALEVPIRSPEIQDAEPIRSAPMTEAPASSRGGVELLADDLVDPAMVARHLEVVHQAEQWMKVNSLSFRVVNPLLFEYSLTCIFCAGRRGEVSREVQHAARLW